MPLPRVHTCTLGQYLPSDRPANLELRRSNSNATWGNVMHRILNAALALTLPSCFAAQAAHAQSPETRTQTHPPRLEEAKAKAAAAARIAPAPLMLFGVIPVSTRSQQARMLTEQALDKYENVMLNDSIVLAEQATQKDHDFALGYAVLAFAARRSTGNTTALARAKSLLPRATPDEQLMVRWMTSIQDRNLLPAIASMNDLLKRYPNNKHVLYLTSEWLYTQEDFEHAQKMLESLLQLDSNFPPALNMLGYSYIESGHPDPEKAVAYSRRYVQVDPSSPNPEDSLGEVLRYAGQDEASLEHYGAALQVDPTFFTSQLGLGDTLTLMGKYDQAREEYDRAILMGEDNREVLHASYQKALVYFWEGHLDEGQRALDALAKQAAAKNESNAQVEIAFGAAMLTPEFASELHQLRNLEQTLSENVEGMSGADRGAALAKVLCEEARVASQHQIRETAEQAIATLEKLASRSGDQVVANQYDTARGYLHLSQGDLGNAANELSSNRHSPLAVQQLARVQQKSGDQSASAESLLQLKYQRAPTAEWYLVSQLGLASQ
jgi:tetratricopeptide (TPR) repeat protein